MDAHHAHADDSILLCSKCAGQRAVKTAAGSFYVLDHEAVPQTRVPKPHASRRPRSPHGQAGNIALLDLDTLERA